jgi:hypothetical protein
MDWNCILTEERLSDHLDGSLSPVEVAAFSAHAVSCEQCAKLIAQVSGTVSRMQQLEPLEAPTDLVSKILDATLGPGTEKQKWNRWFTWLSPFWQPRFVMGVATVAATLLIVLYTTGLSPAKLKKADLSPGNVLRSANRQVHMTYARSAKFVNDLRVVYEIQSRLQPEQEPQPNATPAPAPQQNPEPSSKNPQEKSQTAPHPGHSQARNGVMLAVLTNGNWLKTLATAVPTIATLNSSSRSTR